MLSVVRSFSKKAQLGRIRDGRTGNVLPGQLIQPPSENSLACAPISINCTGLGEAEGRFNITAHSVFNDTSIPLLAPAPTQLD